MYCHSKTSLYALSRLPLGERSKHVGVEVVAIATTPSRAEPSLYEVMISDIPSEPASEFRLLQQTHESATNGHFFSKEEMKARSLRDLDAGLLDLELHVAPSRNGVKRPALHPSIAAFNVVAQELLRKQGSGFEVQGSTLPLPTEQGGATITRG